MKFTDDTVKVSTIISQVTDILTAPELPCPEAVGELLRQDGIYRRFITSREQAAGWKL